MANYWESQEVLPSKPKGNYWETDMESKSPCPVQDDFSHCVAITTESTPESQSEVANDAPGLTADDPIARIMDCEPEGNEVMICYRSDLTGDQRFALAMKSTPNCRGRTARFATGLTSEQRMALAMGSTPEWCIATACFATGLTHQQRITLAMVMHWMKVGLVS